eukprot:m.126574 g.126574  ORF g.126574 m.126574 type:complete len:70 (-) comp29209_c0_seq2:1335-1544(-)
MECEVSGSKNVSQCNELAKNQQNCSIVEIFPRKTSLRSSRDSVECECIFFKFVEMKLQFIIVTRTQWVF